MEYKELIKIFFQTNLIDKIVIDFMTFGRL